MTFSEVAEREHISLEYRDIKALNLNIKETKFIKIKRTSGKQFVKNLHETNFF